MRDNQSVKRRYYPASRWSGLSCKCRQFEAKIKSSKANLENIQATIAMQQSIIQSASETWQAVKHEEQKRLRDTERYEKLAQSAAISQQIIDNARFDYQQVAAKERKAANDFRWRSNGWQFYLLRKKTYVQVSKKFRPLWLRHYWIWNIPLFVRRLMALSQTAAPIQAVGWKAAHR